MGCCGGHGGHNEEHSSGHNEMYQGGNTETAVFNVKGMTCNHCVMSIQKGVGEVKGVKKVDVSLQEGKATVEYNPAETNPNAIKTAIEDVGYDVE